jgi:hypothetical protein
VATRIWNDMSGVFWVGLIIGAMVSLATAEMADISAWMAPRVVHRAVKRLPAAYRERYEEEWNAELSCYDGLKLIRLYKSIQIWLTARTLGRCLSDGQSLSFAQYLRNLKAARMFFMPTPSEFKSFAARVPDTAERRAVVCLFSAHIVVLAQWANVRPNGSNIEIRFQIPRKYIWMHTRITSRAFALCYVVAMKRAGCSFRQTRTAYRDIKEANLPKFGRIGGQTNR